MGVLVIIGHNDLPKLAAAIAEQFPEPKSYSLSPAAWFVEFDGTPDELGNALKIT